MNAREKLKAWGLKCKNNLSNGLAILLNPIVSKMSSMAGEAVDPGTELTEHGANSSENDMATTVSISGTASSSGQYPEAGARPADVGSLDLPHPTMPGSSSSHLPGQESELILDLGDAGLDYELRVSSVEPDEGSVPDPESQPGSSENNNAVAPGMRAHLTFRTPVPAPYILFGLKTNIALSLVNVKLIHELKLPGSIPTMPESVLAAAAGIGLLASSSAICLQVKNPRSVLAKALSQISTISLGSSLLVKLSTRFLFEQYEVVNIIATAVLFLFIVGVVIQVGRSAAVY